MENTNDPDRDRDLEESIAAIRAGIADEAAGRVIPLHEAAALIRQQFGFADPD